MMQPIADKHDTQILSFKDFVDSVFTELNSPTNDWYADLSEDGYNKPTYWENTLTYWKNTLIPLAIRLYELAQSDDAVYWWLLQLMSQVDVCKDGKEDFRKSDVFAVLSTLKREHQKTILEKCVPNCAEELQKALENNEQDAFKRNLPVIDENDAFYSIGRVLKRVEEVRDIYKKTMSHTEGDSLGILFVLFRRYYVYFGNAYKGNNRSCDGMAKNVFLALYQTQYRVNKIGFCEIADFIGNKWVRGVVLAYHNYNTQMPPAANDMVLDTLQKQYKEFCDALINCLTEKQKVSLMEEYGGWFKLEGYGFICSLLEEEHNKIIPPFSCRCDDVRHIRRVRVSGSAKHHIKHVNLHYRDNCVPYIESKNAIPLEELKAIATFGKPVNVEMANSGDGIVVNTKGPLYPESKWGFVPDDYFEKRPSKQHEEYYDRERFEKEYKAKGLDCFAELINYLAEEGCIPNDDETKALLAYRLTGLNKPAELKKIPWKGKTSEDSPLELYYLVKYWVVHNHKKNPQCEEFFEGPHWKKNPSQKVKDCSHEFQRELSRLYGIPPEYE